MNCPKCRTPLETIEYEGVKIETCDGCGGEFLDVKELGQVVRRRDEKFDQQTRRAIAELTTITGVKLDNVDRDLTCPKCGGTTDPINYGGDSGIILDKCTSCGGFWMDNTELEKVQMVVEGWEDALPDDLKEHGRKLREVEAETDQALNVKVSRIPKVGRFINSMINGILDLSV